MEIPRMAAHPSDSLDVEDTPMHRPARFVVSLTAMALACAPGGSPDAPAPSSDTPRLFENLGDLHHPITTSSDLAQRYFDQGLVLAFGFNHEAAERSFDAALEADPSCAMCAWGKALVLGPNINMPMGPEAERRAFAATQHALELAKGASEREQAYIFALATRYVEEPREDRSELDRAYASAMRAVHQDDPTDVDAATLYAESLMDLSPWDYWTEDLQPRPHTKEALAALEAVLEAAPDHVGANHYYIHAVELPYPERAVPAAERLGDLAPDAGHLVHMPSHIFWRVGRYEEAMEINRRAAAADEQFFATCRGGPLYRSLYYPHNVHFLWAAAAAEGRSDIALSAARKLESVTREGMDEAEFLQEFVAIPSLTLARFGRWDALLGTPAPADGRVYLTGVWHYTRGLALLRTGRTDEAVAELDALATVASRPEAGELALSGGVASAATLLDVARLHLAGEIAAASGDTSAAVAALEEAVSTQDSIPYMEPPPFYFPTRQALGAVLLDADRAAEAEAVYRTDLEHYPSNGWSLFGLAESLRRQGDPAKADWARKGFETAWARADVKLEASRF
jgi:tetratricopeptide (TPR) repeat protein